MNKMKWLIAVVSCLLMTQAVAVAQSTPSIIRLRDGQITWTNVNPALFYTVEWRPTMTTGNWTNSFRNLQDVRSATPTITVDLPMFVRIVGSSNAACTAQLSPTTAVVNAGYYAATNLAQVDTDLAAANIKSNVTIFGITGNLAAASTTEGGQRTGQTSVYQVGDDGYYTNGAAWPNPRFTVGTGVDGTNCVTDNLTGLMWARNANLIAVTNWSGAITACETLNYGGYSDWRLPNIRELQTLFDYGRANPALCDTAGTAQWTEGNPFTGVQADVYWSSTTYAGNPAYALYVHLGFCSVGNVSKANPYYAWSVRGKQR